MAGISLMSKLPLLSQAGEMPERTGKVRSWSVHESGVRMRRERNRDLRSCEVAVRLFFKTSKPYQGWDQRERCVEVSVGL